MRYRIEVKVECATKEEAIAFFQNQVAKIQHANWVSCGGAGGGGGEEAPSYQIYVGPKPLSVHERLDRLESSIAR